MIRKSIRRSLAVGTLAVLGSGIGLSAAPTTVLATGNSSCVNQVDACVTSLNTSSTGFSTPYRGFNVNTPSYVGLQYSNGTAVEDRVNSVRVRTEYTSFTGVCWYRDGNYNVPQTYRRQGVGSWFDNSSVGLSSHRWVSSSCV